MDLWFYTDHSSDRRNEIAVMTNEIVVETMALVQQGLRSRECTLRCIRSDGLGRRKSSEFPLYPRTNELSDLH